MDPRAHLRALPARARREDFGRYFLNSLGVALTVVVLSAVVAFLAAVAVTRFRFRFRTTVLIMFLVAQMVPVEALTIPLFFLVRDIGTAVPGIGLNTLGSLILVASGLLAAVRDLDDARVRGRGARGAGGGRYDRRGQPFRILWRILFPLVAPGLVATSVFSFIAAWNDFLFAKTFIISATEN